MAQFSTAGRMPFVFGPGALANLPDEAARLSRSKSVALITDSFLMKNGSLEGAISGLSAKGLDVVVFQEFAGEPKVTHLKAAIAVASKAGLVIGVGGGTALDIAKIAAVCAAGGTPEERDPMRYALCVNPLPVNSLPKIMIPTTAGTGSEASATNIFANPEGRKVWIWGPETKPDLVLLDPALTVSLPSNITACCGMDAFVHAFEAATSRSAHAGANLYAHEALRLVAGALERAVSTPSDLKARGDLLLASFYGGVAIDNCGTAIAHNISHALAALAPVHHGLATALAFEVTLPWLVERPSQEIEAAARACGVTAKALPAFVSALMDRCGISRALPDAFTKFSAADFAREMSMPEAEPMRKGTVHDVTDEDIVRFAEAMHKLVPGKPTARL